MKQSKAANKEIVIHGVIGDGVLMDLHTHGLDKYNHPEFQVFAPSIYRVSAVRLLNSLAEAIINKDEKFKANENCEWGEWGIFTFTEYEKGILSIIPILPECDCCKDGKHGEE